MTLLEDALSAATAKRGPVCSAGRAIETNPTLAVELDELFDAVEHKTVTGPVASEVLKRYGIDLTDEVIRRHARRRCQCR